jgi:hypothetical protein
MKTLLLLGLLACAIHGTQAGEFVYDLKGGEFWPGQTHPDRFVFSVRQQGEEKGVLCVNLPPDHPWRKLMEARRATGDLEFSYFRIRTEVDLYLYQASPVVVIPFYESGRPHIDPSPNIYQGSSMVTQKTIEDMAKNSQYQRQHTPRSQLPPILPGFTVKEWSEITQNQFLNINPRKVKPPEDAK